MRSERMTAVYSTDTIAHGGAYPRVFFLRLIYMIDVGKCK